MCADRMVNGPSLSVQCLLALQDALSHRVLQRFALRESHDTPLRNLDRRTRLRVASGARLALTGLERAEADERDRVAFLQRPGDAVDQRFNCGGGAGFRRTG